MVTPLVLFWILLSTYCVHGEDQRFQGMHSAVYQVLTDISHEIDNPVEIYRSELMQFHGTPAVVIVENTNTSLYILDISGAFKSFVSSFVGSKLSFFLFECQNFEPSIMQQLSDIDSFDIIWGYKVLSFCYNISLVSSADGTIIDSITTEKWDGTTLRSIFDKIPLQFTHVKRMMLTAKPITQLTVKDFTSFPELETLVLSNTSVTEMEDGLLCHVHITILAYLNSFSLLRIFPMQIFNCRAHLKLEYFNLQDHNIAYLPALAFGSAAKQLKWIELVNIGLQVIHEDAFKGLMSVQFLILKENKLSQIPETSLLLSSTNLHKLRIIDHWYRYTGALNFTAISGTKQSQLQMFEWRSDYAADVVGNFCSNQSHSALEIIIFESTTNMTETLAADTFDYCVSLKFISVTYGRLAYLPERLFAANVSRLETLLLVGNKLNSNTSWSDVLMPLHELKYLNLSMNMLTSWTYNLSSLWSLEMLDLSHNSITKVSHTAFMNMTRLNFLSLENNSLAFLTPEVQGMFGIIPMLYLGSNNISQLNISGYTVGSDTRILNVSANRNMELGFYPLENCTRPCGKASLFGDDNLRMLFTLQCSNTQQYAMVSLTNSLLNNFSAIFPDVYVQQCSIETLNVSGNRFTNWSVRDRDTVVNFYKNYKTNVETPTHRIKTLDMTHCHLQFISQFVFIEFAIELLDLRENLLTVIPTMAKGMPYPNILDVRFNQIGCTCELKWVMQYLGEEASTGKNEIRWTDCWDVLWNRRVDVSESLFLCELLCPQQIQQQCDKGHRCYGLRVTSEIDTVVCLSSYNITRLPPNLITPLHQLHVSGFNLTTLELPYVKPHNLTHLNLTSCNISVIPATTFINTPLLELLVLVHNAIQNLGNSTFYPLALLKYLDLSYNKLLSFDAELIHPLFSLGTVYLQGNRMKQLSLETLEEFKMLNILSLQDNPWICECNDTFGHWIVEQLHKGILLDPENITCGGTDVPVMFSNMTCTTHTKIHVHHGSTTATLVSSVLGSISIVALVVCVLIYKYRSTLSVLAFIYMPRCSRKRTESDDVRGVFAICDDKERGARVWIKDSLLPFIECACPLLWSERTFMLGEDMADEIQNAVEQSNCAIILLSRRFLQNEWSCCMFQAAFNEVRERKRPYKIILILTPDITVKMLTSDENCPQDLRVLLKTQQLVYMSEKFYYETLLYLLPESCRSTQQIMTVRGEDIITSFYQQSLTPHMLKMFH